MSNTENEILVLNADDVRSCLPMSDAIKAMESAFTMISDKSLDIPQRMHLETDPDNTTMLIMPVTGAENKTGLKIVSVAKNNIGMGLPMIHGLMLLIDSITGKPLALLNAESLTSIRTGAASGLATDILADPDCYNQLEDTSALLHQGLADAAQKASVPVTINRAGSIMSCFFTDKPVKNFADVQNTDISLFKKFFSGLLDGGVYIAPSAFEAMFISLAHSKEDIEKTIEIAQNVFRDID